MLSGKSDGELGRRNIRMAEELVVKRVVVYGAGRGGQLVAEMLVANLQVVVVGLVDDDPRLWARQVAGYPVLGGRSVLNGLRSGGRFDSLVLSMATPTTMQARRELYFNLKTAGFEFFNAVHPAAIISPSACLGDNNVISAGAVISTAASIGDNNRISAHCNIEHHSVVGSHNFFGSHCVTGGAVTIGDNCVFGLGVCIESLLRIGNNVRVASGVALSENVPEDSVIEA
jgi:UDP-perosamine 4-acetyltransferase